MTEERNEYVIVAMLKNGTASFSYPKDATAREVKQMAYDLDAVWCIAIKGTPVGTYGMAGGDRDMCLPL